MFAIKVKYHVLSLMQKLFYKLIYRKKIKIGKKVSWRKALSLVIEGRGHIEIADHCFFNNYCSINSLGTITIGEDTIFGENVKIYDHNHRFRDHNVRIKEQGYSVGKVEIGSNCWIGSNVTLLKNTTIGNHCVIGAGITLSGNVPDNTIVRQADNNYVFEKMED